MPELPTLHHLSTQRRISRGWVSVFAGIWSGDDSRREDGESTATAMSDLFKIAGGYVYDPINGMDGQVHDIWIQGGKIMGK